MLIRFVVLVNLFSERLDAIRRSLSELVVALVWPGITSGRKIKKPWRPEGPIVRLLQSVEPRKRG